MPEGFMRFLVLGAFFLLLLCNVQAASAGKEFAPAMGASYFSEQQKMTYLRTVIAKLKETSKAMNDLSELETMGMPTNEINRLQGAMKIKLEQLTDEALVLIRAL